MPAPGFTTRPADKHDCVILDPLTDADVRDLQRSARWPPDIILEVVLPTAVRGANWWGW
ncbi:MAG TPA: hypothetical protein VFG68_10405 [Fimbriiglobus sp.]|nr:hypothetical protein [Fimbriiglobus sp.]